jgi:hypothetical protein
MSSPKLNTQEAAEIFGVKANTLEIWLCKPKHLKQMMKLKRLNRKKYNAPGRA